MLPSVRHNESHIESWLASTDTEFATLFDATDREVWPVPAQRPNRHRVHRNAEITRLNLRAFVPDKSVITF
jgi:hypothetical protein